MAAKCTSAPPMRATSAKPAPQRRARRPFAPDTSPSIFGRATPEIASPSNRRDFGGDHWFWPRRPSFSRTPTSSEAPRRRTRLSTRRRRRWGSGSPSGRSRASRRFSCSTPPALAIPLGTPTSLEQNGADAGDHWPLVAGAPTPSYGAPPRPTDTRRMATSRSACAARGAPPGAGAQCDGHSGRPDVAGRRTARSASTPAPIRWAEFVALLLLIGATVFRLAVLPESAASDDASRDGASRIATSRVRGGRAVRR